MNPEIIDERQPTIQKIRPAWKLRGYQKAVQTARPAVYPDGG